MATSIDGDAALMAEFLRNNPQAARELYDRFASRIFGLGLTLFRNRTDAEDLVQDTFLKVLRTGSAFDPSRGSLDAWILLNARGLSIDRLRRQTNEARKLASEPPVSEASPDPGPEWHAELRDLFRRVSAAMTHLSRRQRSVLELTYLAQHTTREAAELLGIPQGTVKSRAASGLAVLQKTFREPEEDDAA
jgi:RNA polymerase sigma-70 factor, ECF subfamily